MTIVNLHIKSYRNSRWSAREKQHLYGAPRPFPMETRLSVDLIANVIGSLLRFLLSLVLDC